MVGMAMWGWFELSGEELIPDGQLVGCIDVPGPVSSYNFTVRAMLPQSTLFVHTW